MKLKHLQQRGSVSDYCNRFEQTIAPIRDMTFGEQLFWFTEGLNVAIKTEVMKKDPKSLHEAMVTAVKAESYLAPTRGNSYVPRANFPSSYPRSTGNVGSGNAPMELSAVQEEVGDDKSTNEINKSEGVTTNPMEQMMKQMQQMFLAAMSQRPNVSSNNRNNINRPRLPPVPGLKHEEIERLMKEGRCFRCKEKGHMKNECPKSGQLKW